MSNSLAPSSSRARWCGPLVAVALVLPAPVPVHASEPAGISEAAQSAYDRGLVERDEGRFASAAREFAAAYAQIAETSRELRAAVLFDLVDAHRQAFAAGGQRRGSEHPAAHLCAADRSLADFIEAEQERKRGRKTPDVIKATKLRDQVRQEFLAARASESDLDCAALELPRMAEAAEAASDEPVDEAPRAPKNPKKLLVAGGVTTALGLGLLGMMVAGLVRGQRARDDGAALVAEMPTLMPEDPQLRALERQGRGSNAMAMVGGVFGSLAFGAGVALLVVGTRAKKRAAEPDAQQLAVWPLASPVGGGAAVRWRF